MAKYVKNNSGVQKTWLGKVLENQEWYDIPSTDELSWGSDSIVLADILNGNLIAAKTNDGTTNYIDTNQAINFLKNLPGETDQTGRTIIRTAATVKGWHYQAHSVQFEVNKLLSIYNKDSEGNDLGYSTIKIYKANGDECTTQGDADLYGVKTIVTWKPDFNFEIISGSIRQVIKETIDSYLYVNAKVPTGLPSPNDWLKVPFVQGGINLNYIGADEPLKTDGRASKLFSAGTNGDYFEAIINYEAEALTNQNRHKMSIIFEIYKDPTS